MTAPKFTAPKYTGPPVALECLVCGGGPVACNSERPKYLASYEPSFEDGQPYWLYCHDCDFHLTELYNRARKHKRNFAVVPRPFGS